MPVFWKHVNIVLKEADIIIEVLDARMVEESRNREIERKVIQSGKKILYVITKCDLMPDREKLEEEKKRLTPSVFISSKEHLGTTMLRKKILELSRGEKVVVGVVGYPNVGKSSLINVLAGRAAARTSAESGFTKGLQKVRVGSKIMLLDTPGVFPKGEKKEEKNQVRYAKMGAIDFAKIKDPERVVLELLQQENKLLCAYYGVEGADPEELLEKIALKLKIIGKKGVPNVEIAARRILKYWQEGKIKSS